MAARRWLLIGLSAALLGGCAHHVSVIDERVARLPAPERQRIVNVQQNVDVAQSNLVSARVARSEARQFFGVAQHQLRAAKARLDAAHGALELARRAQDPERLRLAEGDFEPARQQVIAARLERDYAERLVVLRGAELAEREAELDVATADLQWVKLAELNRRDLGTDLDAQPFSEARRQARAELARSRQRVAALRTEVAQLRQSWEERRGRMARAAIPSQPSNDPPPPPRPLPPPVPIPSSPRPGPTDVNEGPSAPQSIPNQNFAH